jgi:hypothetical protein
MLKHNERGNYRFLPGIAPYSCGAIADRGHEVVHVTFLEQPQWEEGFDKARAYIHDAGLDRFALCGIELRCPSPYPLDGFIEFNSGYCDLLQSWELYVDGINPLARTNVAPTHDAPQKTAMHGFSFVSPTTVHCTTYIVAGAGELRHGDLEEAEIVKERDTTAGAMAEKAAFVAGVMAQRMSDLGGSWQEVTTVDVYTAHTLDETLTGAILNGLGDARRHGFRWYPSRPPVVDIEFEMDMRAVKREVYI